MQSDSPAGGRDRSAATEDPASAPPGPAEDPAQPLAQATMARRKRRDTAIALPLLGVVLFMSPLIDLAAAGDRLAGIPVGVLYVFGAWFALIFATGRLARRLYEDAREP